MPLHSDRAFYPTILGLAQDRTEAIMAETLAALGGTVRYGVALTSLEVEAGHAVARLSDGTTEIFDTIIGADGVKSIVRKEAGITYPGTNLAETWSIADVDVDNWRHPGKITLIQAEPGKVVVIAPLGANRYRVVASAEDALKTLTLPMNVTNVRREGIFKISIRQAQTYSKGCIHLAGDAAHCHSPVGGRGMNLGIADAADLAQRIAKGDLENYSITRHREGAEAITATERGRKMTAGMDWSMRITFRAVLASANAFEMVKRRLGRFIVEL